MNMNSTITNGRYHKIYINVIWVLSLVVPIVVTVLIFNPSKFSIEGGWVSFLPHLNGMMNTFTAIALLFGYYFIKNDQPYYHRIAMISAFVMGCIFLVSYIIYHSSSSSTHFGGEGLIRYIYFSLLISHISLAAIVVPFVLLSIYFGLTNKVNQHKKVSKWTFPIWLFVSVSGVIVYLMISPYYL